MSNHQLISILWFVFIVFTNSRLTDCELANNTKLWIPAQDGHFPARAFVAASNPIDNMTSYICQATDPRDGAVIPGKLIASTASCNIARTGSEQCYSNYSVLIQPAGVTYEWVRATNGNYPKRALIGGRASGWPLPVCRANLRGKWVPGKLDPEPEFACCYVPYQGDEYCEKSYEVLCAP